MGPGKREPEVPPRHRRRSRRLGRVLTRPICGRPPACKSFGSSADQIACDHMSGLLSRSHMTAAKMGFAT